MARPNEKKKNIVNDLTEDLKGAKSIVLTDYRGMTMKQLEDLRKALRAVNAQFTIAKNTLLRISLGDTGKDEKLQSSFKEPTAVLISKDDEVAPLKELAKFIKLIQKPIIKAGILGNSILTSSEVERLSKLPTREVLIAQLLGGLNSPISGLVYALNGNIQKLVFVLSKINNNPISNSNIK